MSPVVSLWSSWFIVGLSPLAGDIANRYAHSFVFVFLSCLFCFLSFLPSLIKSKKIKLFAKTKHLFSLLMVGTFGTALPLGIMIYALNFTDPVNMGIFNQVEIVYSLIFAYVFLGEKPEWQQFGGAFLVAVGVGIILFHDLTGIKWKGDLLVVGSVWMRQVSHIFVKKLPKEFDYKTITGARALFAMPALLIVIAVMALSGADIAPNFTWAFAGVLAFSAFLDFGIGNLFWYQAIRNMDLGKATVVILSYPCLTFVVTVMLRRPWYWHQVLGLGLAFAGAYWVTTLVKKNTKKEMADAIAAK